MILLSQIILPNSEILAIEYYTPFFFDLNEKVYFVKSENLISYGVDRVDQASHKRYVIYEFKSACSKHYKSLGFQ